ncbi:MAG: riboflavin synthase [Verrucomicrobiota bacterium]|nr:riboflavin synthase [Verrucomicrobiota bacterium]
MFTGLIQNVGTKARLSRAKGGAVLVVSHEPWEPPLTPGESVAVQGVCLTVASCGRTEFSCDLLEETLSRANLDLKRSGAKLNLERALRPTDRLGGHFVTGHVDETGRIAAIERRGRDVVLRLRCSLDRLWEMAPKGSIACDGVSLTIAALNDNGFDVHVIPFTWDHTSFSEAKVGDAVNLETDILGKYARRLAEGRAPSQGIGFDALARAGFR